MTETQAVSPNEWQRLSPWSILHFAQKAIVENVQVMLFAGGPAAFGASQWASTRFAWVVPIAIIALVLVSSFVTFLFYRYRLLEDAIQVKRGALFKKHMNLSFARIQNVNIEHPFYFRPFGRVTLKIDGAGAKEEEVSVAALALPSAEAARRFIVNRKHGTVQSGDEADGEASALPASEIGELLYQRSVGDLVIHGLTNNRAFIAVAAILGFLFQSGMSPADIAERLGIDFDIAFAGLSLVRFAVLIVISFIAAIGIIALLSVLVSIVTYYGFSIYRTPDSLTIKRGLLTKHEVHVKKSRIQTIQTRQDWLDRLLGRHNVILERITHSAQNQDPLAAQKSRIFVPSVRVHETAIITDEILPGVRTEELRFTPINVRYFVKRAALILLLYVVWFVLALFLPEGLRWVIAALTALTILLIVHTYLSYKRGGLAVDGDIVIARSGAIGIDYRMFSAEKVQDVTHIQSILMRRHDLSSLRFHTASTAIKVPHMPSAFMRKVVDFCAYRVESAQKSWM